jgi:hypothetical protein
MKIRPDVNVDRSKDGKIKSYYIGVKGSVTFEEVSKFFKKIINVLKKNKNK